MANRSDTFNRADSSTSLGTPSDGGSAWVAGLGTWGISSNAAYSVDGASPGAAYLEASSADVDVQVTMTVAHVHGGLIARYSDSSNFWILDLNTNSNVLRLQKYSGGSFGTSTDFSHTPANGDVIKLSVSGSTINVYLNSTLVIGPITDAFNNTATKHGLFGYGDSTMRLDNLSITDTGGGSVGAVPRNRNSRNKTLRRM